MLQGVRNPKPANRINSKAAKGFRAVLQVALPIVVQHATTTVVIRRRAEALSDCDLRSNPKAAKGLPAVARPVRTSSRTVGRTFCQNPRLASSGSSWAASK